MSTPKRASGLAIISLVSGGLGLALLAVLWFWGRGALYLVLAIVCSGVALVTGLRARQEIRRRPSGGKGTLVAAIGLALGAVHIGMWLLLLLTVVIAGLLRPSYDMFGSVYSSLR